MFSEVSAVNTRSALFAPTLLNAESVVIQHTQKQGVVVRLFRDNLPKPISKTKRIKVGKKILHYRLLKDAPELFLKRDKPLTHEIREQILEKYPDVENDVVLRYLHDVFATASYLEAIVKNNSKVRLNLDLTETSFISTEQRKKAANYLVIKMNDYRKPKTRAKYSHAERLRLYDVLISLDSRFDVQRYELDKEEFLRYLKEERQANTVDKQYGLTETMWPDNF